MSEKNKKPAEKLSLKEIIGIVGIVVVLIIGFSVAFSAAATEKDIITFSINTLSSEQLAGETYTERTRYDDSDLWETEAPINSEITVVVLSEELSVTETTVEFPIDINLANIEELILIEGIGMVTAEKIVSYRNMYGYFTDYRQLLNIDGIGEKKLANFMKYIYISDEWLEIQTELSETTVVTTVPLIDEETTTVSRVVTEDIIIVNEEFVYDDFDDITDVDYDYDFESDIENRYVNFPLELNSATVEELMCIDGIGEYTAHNIAAYARKYGFYSVDELLNVDGIGNLKFVEIMPYVYVDLYKLPPKAETIFTEYEITTELIIQQVNINTCGKYELMQLPGIDELLADKIIEFREKIGGYQDVYELTLVDGVTNEKMSDILEYLYI